MAKMWCELKVNPSFSIHLFVSENIELKVSYNYVWQT